LDVDGRSHDGDDATGTNGGCPDCAAMHDELERASEALCVAQGRVRAQQSLIDACAPDSRCTERSMVTTASVDRLSAAVMLIKRQRECIEQMSDAAAVRSSVSDVAGGVKVAVLQDSTLGQHGGGLDVEMIHDMVRVCVCVWVCVVSGKWWHTRCQGIFGVSTTMSGPLRMCNCGRKCRMVCNVCTCYDGQGRLRNHAYYTIRCGTGMV
jgi:hypothetical protein